MDDLEALIVDAVGDERDPYPDYARHRREAPVAIEEGEDWFNVYRYADVVGVLGDPKTFSSRAYAPGVGEVFGPSIIIFDGVEHQRKRGIIGGSFRRTAVERLGRELMEPTVHALIDGFADAGRADLVRDLTIQYPIQIIAEMLGIPRADYRWFLRESIAMIGLLVDPTRGLQASDELGAYFARVLDERRREPREDLISILAQAEVEGEPLPDEEILGFLRLLLPAGAETTYRLLGTLLFALLHDRAQYETVAADRSLLPRAMEEALRWESPVQFITREPVIDVELGGVEIAAGTHVSLVLGSANRDETVFDEPDRFDLFAERAPHVAFADGPHRCLGEHLARAEVIVAMNAVLDRLKDLRFDPDAPESFIQGEAFRSPNRLPVLFTA